MNITFFAARKLHQEYFSTVADQIKSDGSTASVLWHKDLWKTPLFLFQLLHAFTANSRNSLNSIVHDHELEKRNSRKGLKRHFGYWKLFRAIKVLESLILFAIYRHALKQTQASHMVIWNGLKYRQRIAIAAADSLNMKTIYMENGLLPGKTTIDARGINYRNSVPRNSQAFEQLAPIDLEPLSKALRDQFQSRPAELPENYIFVPFQVNTDSQVVLFSPWIKTMFDLVENFRIAIESLGAGAPHIVFKPHPACDHNYDELIAKYQQHPTIHFSQDINTAVLIQHADAVATINSTVGIESLLLNKKLIVLGQAFYSYPEISLTAGNIKELSKAMAKVADWKPDHLVIQGLFNYLANTYQLTGRWQDASPEHIEACSNRIQEIANG